MSKLKKLLVISNSWLESDPRVRRQIQWLNGQFEISVVAISAAGLGEKSFFKVPDSTFGLLDKVLFSVFSIIGFYKIALSFFAPSRRQRDLLGSLGPFDLIIVNDLVSLPSVYSVWPNAKVVFDSHEYYPGQFSGLKYHLVFNPFFKWLSRKYIPKVDLFIAVSNGVGRAYKKLGAPEPMIILNAPSFYKLEAKEASQSDGFVRLVHHGGAQRLRHLELMIQLMEYLPENFHLTLLLMPTDPAYLKELKVRASNSPRILFKQPVKFDEIVPELSKYDIGVFLLPPVTDNYRHALPNKFFEYLNAGLGVAIGPSEEMADILMGSGAGIIVDSFDAENLARQLKDLSHAEIAKLKERAKELSLKYNAEIEGEKFKLGIEKIIEPSNQ